MAIQIGDSFAEKPYDGILGLGFKPINSNVQPPIIKAIEQNLLNQPIFTVWLSANEQEMNVPSGIITYGGIDTDNCNTNFNYYPLNNSEYYKFDLNSVSVWK